MNRLSGLCRLHDAGRRATTRHTAVKPRFPTLAVLFSWVAHVDQDLCFPLRRAPACWGMCRRTTLGVVALAASWPLAAAAISDSNTNAEATARLAVLETTDLHFNVRSYDYFKTR